MLLANPHVQISPEVFSEAMSDKTPTFDTDKWGNKMLDTLEERLTEKVEDLLPTIVKKFTKPWVDNFRKSQSEFKGEINKVFRDTLTVTLQETQHETVNAISAKQDAEAFEKKRRVSNIVIRGVPESDSDKTEIRKQEDTDFNKYLCNLQAGEIIKVFRAGKRDENPTLPRPIIATVSFPELANRLHKYGNGGRVVRENKVWWINPDLTANERKRNFECRQLRRALLKSGTTFPPTNPINLTSSLSV